MTKWTLTSPLEAMATATTGTSHTVVFRTIQSWLNIRLMFKEETEREKIYQQRPPAAAVPSRAPLQLTALCACALQIFVPRRGDEAVPEDHAPGSEQDARRRDQGRRRQGCPAEEVWDEGELSQMDSLQRHVCMCCVCVCVFSGKPSRAATFSLVTPFPRGVILSANGQKVHTFSASWIHV